MCTDCLNRLLQANYFRDLLLHANKTFAHLVSAVTKQPESKPKVEEKRELRIEEMLSQVITEVVTDETVLGTEDVPEASGEQEVEVLISDYDTNEMFKIEHCSQEEQKQENDQLLEHCCCMCTYIFSSEEELRFHCQTDHTIQPLNTKPETNQCRLCCSHFGNEEDLYNHKTCENCFECFATNEDLIEHLKVHEFDTLEVQAVEVARQLEQEIIETEMPSAVDRKRPRPRNFSDQSAKRRINREDINNLPRVANTFPCCLCATFLSSEKERSSHMIVSHDIPCDQKFDPKRMTCIYCNRQFERMDQYYGHFEVPIRKQNRCTKCGRNFLTPELLQQHDLNIHSADTPTYNCQACKMLFATANAYYSHNHRHHTTKPKYSCEICGDVLITPSKLKEHRNVHLNIKDFVCNICNKSFIRKDNLRNHLRVHTGVKPYSCEFCQKSFGHYTDMKRHRYIHTGEYPFKCADCGKGFVKKSTLDTHLKFHKGKPHEDKSKHREQPFICAESIEEIPENSEISVKIVLVDDDTQMTETDNET